MVVDDLLIASDSKAEAKRVIAKLRKAGLDTKDLGVPSYVIGVHIKRHKNGDISLNQRLYIETLLRRFHMQDANVSTTPANPTVKLTKKLEATTEKEKLTMSKRPYRSLVGALLYTLITRPDCAVAVNELARFLNNPGKAMWTAAKRVLRYLKATKHYSVRLKAKHGRKHSRRTAAFVDSSHADDKDERRSRCGHFIYYNGSPIHWRTVLQKRKALSTAEAEYRAATICTKDVMWLRNLLSEIGRKEKRPTVLYEDNKACIKMIENPVISGRNKYVELDCHFVRDHHVLNNIRVKKISTQNQRADLLTKNLARPSFDRHTDTILDCRRDKRTPMQSGRRNET